MVIKMGSKGQEAGRVKLAKRCLLAEVDVLFDGMHVVHIWGVTMHIFYHWSNVSRRRK